MIAQGLWQAHQILSIIIKCKSGHNKKFETRRTKYKNCDCFLEYPNFKDDLIEHRKFCCNKSYQQKFDEKLKERFLNANKYSNHDNNKFILLLQKGVYPHKYMDDWIKFNEILHEKEDFYGHLNMEDITNADFAHAKGVCKDFEIKNLREYHNLYVQRDSVLASLFENFWNMCHKIYELDPARFLSALGLARQTALKKSKVKLDLWSDMLLICYINNILLMVEKGIRRGICHSIYQHAKANDK